MQESGYHCTTCGAYHEELPLSYVAVAPAFVATIPADEYEARVDLSSDVCVVDNEHFFILGNIDIPILDTSDTFCWSVWVSLSEPNFTRTLQLWGSEGRESEPPMFGWLSTQLPHYPDTLNLKTMVYTRVVGERPFIELEPTEHPLAIEQHTGITRARVQEIAELILHQEA